MRAKSVYCGCGAQWHGKYTESAVIAGHQERWATCALGCTPLTHKEFATKFSCKCDACDVARAEARAERARERAGTRKAGTTMKTKSTTADDERFGPMLSAMDEAKERFDLLAGENIYLLTQLLLNSIQDAPVDVRELFRGAAVQALLLDRGAGRVLRELCLDGRLPEA